jgi:hypothetical protein
MAKDTKINGCVELDIPWHMVNEKLSHDLGFAGRDIYDLIVEVDSDKGRVPHKLADRDLAPEDLVLDQA